MTAVPAWATAVLDGVAPRPTVLVLGGFLTSAPQYRPLAGRLVAHGAADVVIGNVWLPDWLLAARRGLGPILTRSGRALLEASERSAARSHGAPVMVVGHSAGGMSARLLTSPVPFAGRTLNGHGRIGAIVTLGTPHLVSGGGELGSRVGVHAATFANRVLPGAHWAPRVGYVAVTSRSSVGRRAGSLGERRAWAVYEDLLADPRAETIDGDGLIPVASALLPGALPIVLDGADHGMSPGRPWYGSERYVDEWWPAAVEAWRAALLARARSAAGWDDLEAGAAFDGSADRR
jgi:hypothetical protein